MLDERCERLRSLHVRGRPLVLPNAWDAASARAVVAAGFPVVATTSGGVADALGYEDHEGAPAEEMLAAAARIARAVDAPVTVDAEAGYGMAPAELVGALARIGAAGCNLEDSDHARGGLREPGRQTAWLAEVRAAAAARGYPLVVNARVDVFVADRESPQQVLLEAALERARAYAEAGADCVFPILLHDEQTIAAFAREVEAPVNVMALPQAPPLRRLAELGVARVSFGSSLQRRSTGQLAEMLAAIAADA